MTQKPYFAGFDLLRFYAAISVVVSHVSPYDSQTRMIVFAFLDGNHALILFFVLSGFLITHLLFSERENFGAIKLRRFYARRVLRIWPLYFLVLILSILIFHDILAPIAWQSYVLFLGNLTGSFITVPPFYPLWSIGLEEQFYLVWGWILSRTRKNLVPLLVGLIWLHFVLWLGVTAAHMIRLQAFLGLNRVDALAIGCLAAYLYREKKTALIYQLEPLWWGLFVLIIVIPFPDTPYPVVGLLIALLLGALLLCIGTKPRPLIHLPSARMLGNLSYGIYVWHYPIWTLVKAGTSDNALQLLVTIILTLTTSYVSYRLFERPFLQIKDHFQPELRTNTVPIVK